VFGQYGYYSKPLKFNSKGKAIIVNTQTSNCLNIWNFGDGTRTDQGGQLKWLETELLELEAIGGFAYIIGHIPAYDYMHEYGIRYKALIERF